MKPLKILTIIVASLLPYSASYAENDELYFRYSAAVLEKDALTIAPMNLQSIYVGETMNASFASSGGEGQIAWSYSGELPPGITFSNGRFSGTPTASGSYNGITVSATDASGYSAKASSMSITVIEQLVGGEQSASIDLEQPQAISIPASGGMSPLTFELVSGSLPSGMGISGRSISGTPSEGGVHTATIRITDANGRTANSTINLIIESELAVTFDLPDSYMGESYSGKFTATGGSGVYSWWAEGLSSGVAINARTGGISGTFPYPGAFALRATVHDGTSFITTSHTVMNHMLPVLDPKTFADGNLNVAYNVNDGQAPFASGGKAPLTWSATGLPAGLVVDPSNGWISGTPTAIGTTTMVLTITDANGRQASRSSQFSVKEALTARSNLPESLLVGQTVDLRISASGGTAPYSFSGWSLPRGLSVDSSGHITGTTQATGITATGFRVTDSTGKTFTENLTVFVR